MKNKLIVIFSLSLTAGTAYFGYLKFKEFTINKLVKSWADALKNTLGVTNSEQQNKLKSELDKLFLWEVRLLVMLTSRIQNNASDAEKLAIGKKLMAKKVFDRADLADVSGFLEYKKYIV